MKRDVMFDETLSAVPITIHVVVGRMKIPLRDFVTLEHGQTLKLDSHVSDLVELHVAGKLVARGELVDAADGISGGVAVRVTDIVGTQG